MKLSSVHEISMVREVLKNPQSQGPNPVYWVFSDISLNSNETKWVNLTVIAPGLFDGEFPKTHGHYHTKQVLETYKVIEGEGVLILQKKHFEENTWIPNKVDQIVLVKLKAGDEIIISPEWGHSLSNIGKIALLTFDDWSAGHTPSDYEEVSKLKGLALYLTEDSKEIKFTPNLNYQTPPDPIWMNVSEFNSSLK